MTSENERSNAEAEIARAAESLRAAEVLVQAGLFNDAVSDAYYACFHAVRALLFSIGKEVRSHRGVVHLFNVDFVRAGKMDAKYLSVLSRAQYDRGSADYGVEARFTVEQATEEIEAARGLVEAVRERLQSAAG